MQPRLLKKVRDGKGSLFEGGIREPMMVKWPGITKPGSVCKQYVGIQDFFPTILQMIGDMNYKTVQKIDGKSMVPFLKNPDKMDHQRALIWHFPNKWAIASGENDRDVSWLSAIRQGDWKLIYFEKYGRLELYNLKNDIKEEYNLSKQFPKKNKELAALLTKKLKSSNAQMPTFKSTGKQVPWPDEIVSHK